MAEEFVPVRLSHLLRHCSVGAIVRGADSLMVVPDIRRWGLSDEEAMEQEIRYVDRVRSALGIDRRLCRPPVFKDEPRRPRGAIRTRRFPTWMRCLKCGLLHPAPWKDEQRGATQCWGSGPGDGTGNCGGSLEQVPWVIAHEDGYLADVPWHDLAHAKRPAGRSAECRRDWQEAYLVLAEATSGRPRIVCGRCRSRGALEFRCGYPLGTWQQPWFSEPPAEVPEALAWVLEINDVRVHAPTTRTALVIPPESRIRRGTVVDRLYGSTRHLKRIRRARTRLARRSAIGRVAGEYGCTGAAIEKAWHEIERGYPLYGQSVSAGDLRESEYDALLEDIPNLREDEDFVTRDLTAGWKALGARLSGDGIESDAIAAVSRLVAVRRLKEIMVSTGFKRVGGKSVPPDISGDSDWWPAVELYGEGIFFTLDEAVLARWEKSEALLERAEAYAVRYHESEVEESPWSVEVSARFVLCHTLSHLLIRQLEAVAGYPAASLKERLYCAGGKRLGEKTSAAATPMAGILIYVTVADEEGSLGGLAEQVEPDGFLRLLAGALESVMWCSMDPVCGEREGHGPGLLNGAACHACALVPETSCEQANMLLDRTFVTGNGADIPALLDCARGGG